jgi:hypothetical protein
MFENRVLRRIFVPKRDEVTGECRKFHNGDINILYSSLNIKQIKSRKMWVGRGTCGRGKCSGLWES